MEIKKITVLMTMVAFAIGILVTAQWKTPPSRISNPVISYVALNEMANELANKQTYLKTQIASLQKTNKELQSTLKKNIGSSNSGINQLEDLKKEVGLTELNDKGLIITLSDSPKMEANPDSIAHAADMRDIVNFLWLNGAQAISINRQRLTAASSIDCIVNTVLINETRTSTPFVISVIGPQDKLYEAISNKKNLPTIYWRVEKEGLIFTIEKSNSIYIPAYNGSFNIKFAKIKE